jgi:hypothetical protein
METGMYPALLTCLNEKGRSTSKLHIKATQFIDDIFALKELPMILEHVLNTEFPSLLFICQHHKLYRSIKSLSL